MQFLFLSHNSHFSAENSSQIMRDLDYVCSSQMDYFKVMEEARKHQRDPSITIDSVHSKLQKSICKEDLKKTQKTKKKKWWKNALLFLKGVSIQTHPQGRSVIAGAFRAKVSGPLYIANGRSGSSKRHRATRKPSSGPLSGNLAPAETKYELQIPYLNLRDLNMEEEEERRSFTSRIPIYFVT